MFDSSEWMLLFGLVGTSLLLSCLYRALRPPRKVLRIDAESIERSKIVFQTYRNAAGGFEEDKPRNLDELPCPKANIRRALTVLLHYAKRIEDEESLVVLRKAFVALAQFQPKDLGAGARRRATRDESRELVREVEFFFTVGTKPR